MGSFVAGAGVRHGGLAAGAADVVEGGPVVLPGGRSPRGKDRVVPIGRHGHPREEIRAVQRARILDAFVVELGEHGLAHTRVLQVCRRAGVSAKEFYDQFATKEDCFFAAFDVGADLVYDQGATAFAETAGLWEDRVQAAIGAMLEALAANPAFCRLCIVESVQAGPAGVDRLNAVIRRCRTLLGGDRELDAPPGVPAAACESALVGGALQPLAEYVAAGRATELASLVPMLTFTITLATVGQARAIRQLENRGAAG